MENIKKASFNTESKAGKMKAFNAMNGASVSMKTLDDGDVLTVRDVLQHEGTTDQYGNGEQEVTITTLYTVDANGEQESYSSISDTIKDASANLIDLIVGLKLDTVDVKITKQKSQGGREFLNLQVIEDEDEE